MPTTSLITKCQDVLRNDISNESFAGASLTVTDPYGRIQYESVGGGFPLVVVAATSSEEYPEQSGNFFVNMEVRVFEALDPANDDSYATNVSNHTTNVGNVYNYLVALQSSDLNAVSPSAGDLIVDDIKIGTQQTGIDRAEGLLEDIFDLRLYCHIMGSNG